MLRLRTFLEGGRNYPSYPGDLRKECHSLAGVQGRGPTMVGGGEVASKVRIAELCGLAPACSSNNTGFVSFILQETAFRCCKEAEAAGKCLSPSASGTSIVPDMLLPWGMQV